MDRYGRFALRAALVVAAAAVAGTGLADERDWWTPYRPPCVARENVFAFAEKPAIKLIEKDRYEITFAVKGNCDVAVDLADADEKVVRHLGAGVLGSNAPLPFQKGSLSQKIYWNGKDDLGFYVREPETLKVRVRLGLKPTFDKRIGGASGHNLPGYVWGIAIGPDAAYVFGHGTKGHGHRTLRKFDRDGGYVQSLMPPPANLLESKLGGLSYVEYEKGKRAVHGADLVQMSRDSYSFIPFVDGGYGPSSCQPALAGGRLFIPTGKAPKLSADGNKTMGKLLYLYTDGSTDVKGMKGRPFVDTDFITPVLTSSPDGTTIYVTTGSFEKRPQHAVFRCSADGREQAEVFAGDPKKPGSDSAHFNNPAGLDCDAQGRLYVADTFNNRIQVLSPDGAVVKSIPVEKPRFICVHKKTGAIYVLHAPRNKGKTVDRLTKLRSFDRPEKEFHQDGLSAVAVALDSWCPRPRLWLGGEKVWKTVHEVGGAGPSVRILEERDGALTKIVDFDELAMKDAGKGYFGRFMGGASDNRHIGSPKSVCDPVREKLYYRNSLMFDLKSGTYEGRFRVKDQEGFDDIAIDKRGFMHGHSWGTGPDARVWRVDPSRGETVSGKGGPGSVGPLYLFPEVPYDYGVPRNVGSESGRPIALDGSLPVKSQASSHPWQHGLGVNMCGDVAVSSRISYVPKMEETVRDSLFEVMKEREQQGIYVGGNLHGKYASFLRDIQDMSKKGEVYFLPREPGIPLYGDTIWTFDRSGEYAKKEAAAIIGERLAGAYIDEDRNLYFATMRSRMIEGRRFLEDRGGTFGMPDDRMNRSPYLGTYVGAEPHGVRIRMKNAVVKMDPLPNRPPDLWRGGPNWIEGARWLYAGAAPIVEGGCECPSSRPWLDWYKRSFVQEVYRHSIGVLDSNGNLIMHLGKYGNFDSAEGDNSKLPVGGDNIGVYMPRYMGGTDNYLVFNDWGERLVVLRLNYHAEEQAAVETQ